MVEEWDEQAEYERQEAERDTADAAALVERGGLIERIAMLINDQQGDYDWPFYPSFDSEKAFAWRESFRRTARDVLRMVDEACPLNPKGDE